MDYAYIWSCVDVVAIPVALAYVFWSPIQELLDAIKETQ